MEFSANNNIVKLCLQGTQMEENSEPEHALRLFIQAWNEATNDFEKFLAAFYVARHHEKLEKLSWLETALQLAVKINDDAVKPSIPSLYSSIAKCHEELDNPEEAEKNYKIAATFTETPTDKGPFYHGTKADLQTGDFLSPGFHSNYQSGLVMNHIYFTALVHGAGLAAGLAQGTGRERIYMVEPAGSFENDPNVTNKKFPGNPTRSYRTTSRLKIVGEVTEWPGQSTEEIRKWRERLAANNGEIIN